MHHSKIEWVLNPDNKTLGWIWNPLTGCLNRTPEGLCLGGNFPCYAFKLANGRLRVRYTDSGAIPAPLELTKDTRSLGVIHTDPFYPRFWTERLKDKELFTSKPKGIFVCDMSDLFGIGIPHEWTEGILAVIRICSQHRFYLLTKQPQNLAKFSPFPDNCWVGVTATGIETYRQALAGLAVIQAKVKFLSIEPFLERIPMFPPYELSRDEVQQVILGSQTKPYKPPKISWVEEIVEAADRAGVAVFLKDNLRPLLLNTTWTLRQELPREVNNGR